MNCQNNAMYLRIISILLIGCTCLNISGQEKMGLFKKKRKKVEVPNYTLFLNLHDIAIEYSSKIDYKTDSIFSARNITYDKSIFDFRIRTLQSLQHVLYRSDPVIGFLDSWAYAAQMIDYLESPESMTYLSYSHATMQNLFEELFREFPETYEVLYEDPSVMNARIIQFARDYPILDNHQNRTSVVDATAQWVGEASIGFKSGVATLTDAMRNVSDRLNYHSEFTPKMVEWNVQKSVGNLIGTDSLGLVLESSVSSLARITNTLDSIDYLVYSVMDTVLTDIDRQRWETLNFIRSERKAVMEQVSLERQAIMEQVTEERKAIEELVHQERQASLDQIQVIIENTTSYSFDRVDELVNRIFYRALILMTIAAVGIVIAVVLFKKI